MNNKSQVTQIHKAASTPIDVEAAHTGLKQAIVEVSLLNNVTFMRWECIPPPKEKDVRQ
jgi:hypothetical protein